jgi:hypothetical protein
MSLTLMGYFSVYLLVKNYTQIHLNLESALTPLMKIKLDHSINSISVISFVKLEKVFPKKRLNRFLMNLKIGNNSRHKGYYNKIRRRRWQNLRLSKSNRTCSTKTSP